MMVLFVKQTHLQKEVGAGGWGPAGLGGQIMGRMDGYDDGGWMGMTMEDSQAAEMSDDREMRERSR